MAEYLAVPKTAEGRRPCVVIIHEWWGVNDQIKRVADRWAGEGFVALVPDLYDGKLAANAEEAGKLMDSLDFERALSTITTGVATLKNHPRSNGKVAVTGYCLGGALAFATATRVPGLAAVVPFYGLPPKADWLRVDAPIQAHFATNDDWATVDGAKQIQDALARQKKHMELHVYEAQHAFCNDFRPEVYDEAACKQAWQRTLEFVRSYTQ